MCISSTPFVVFEFNSSIILQSYDTSDAINCYLPRQHRIIAWIIRLLLQHWIINYIEICRVNRGAFLSTGNSSHSTTNHCCTHKVFVQQFCRTITLIIRKSMKASKMDNNPYKKDNIKSYINRIYHYHCIVLCIIRIHYTHQMYGCTLFWKCGKFKFRFVQYVYVHLNCGNFKYSNQTIYQLPGNSNF